MADIKYNTIPYSDFQNGDVIDAEKIDLNNKSLIDKQNEVIISTNFVKQEIVRHKTSADHDDRYYPLTNGNSLDNKVNVLDAELTSIVMNTPSSIEVAQALVDANGETHLTLKNRLDNESNERSRLVRTERELINFINSGNVLTLNVGRKIVISSNLTIPDSITLTFNNNGMLSIAPSVTLTLNCNIEAGYRKIFNFESSTSVLTTDNLGSHYGITKAHYRIKLDWFGANPKAQSPDGAGSIDAMPVGQDSTDAVKRAVFFANMASSRYGELSFYPSPILEGTPNGSYYVKGDNILGHQISGSTASRKFTFEGNGCSFFWVVVNENDSFINDYKYYFKPSLVNFDVITYGYTGSKGIFINTGTSTGYVPLTQPYLFNIHIKGGEPSDSNINITKGNSLKKVFNLEGKTMCDQWLIEKCTFSQFDVGVYCSNPESVGILILKSLFLSHKDNAVFFHFDGSYSGGFNVSNTDLLMKGKNQTLFKSSTTLANPTDSDFSFKSSRLETNPNAFTLVDAQFGRVYIDGINCLYGSGGVISTDSVSAKVKHPAVVNFTNSYIPKKFLIDVYTLANYNALGGSTKKCLTLDNVDFGTEPPVYSFYRVDTGAILTYRQVLEAGLTFRAFEVKNSIRYNASYFSANTRNDYQFQHIKSYSKYVSGYQYITAGDFFLPPHIIITSIKIRANSTNTSVVNKIRFKVGDWQSDIALSNSTRIFQELIPPTSVGVSVPVADYVRNKVSAKFYLNDVEVADDICPSYAIITYKPIMGRQDLPNTDVTGLL